VLEMVNIFMVCYCHRFIRVLLFHAFISDFKTVVQVTRHLTTNYAILCRAQYLEYVYTIPKCMIVVNSTVL